MNLKEILDKADYTDVSDDDINGLINDIIKKAIEKKASDIHFEPQEDYFIVRFRIDGDLQFQYKFSKYYTEKIISVIKIKSALDIANKRLPQDGRINFDNIDLRVSVVPTILNEKIVIRILDKENNKLDINSIGLNDEAKRILKELSRKKSGLTVICGPTGSGKNTTLYSLLNEIEKDKLNVVSVEDPVEYNIFGVNQVQINEAIDFTFQEALRSILRQDPDIIAIGEIRDKESCDIAVRAALTGHMILSTLHSQNPRTTINRILEMGVNEAYLYSSLNAIINQRLVKKLCPFCKEKKELKDIDKKVLNSDISQCYIKSSCEKCNNGYIGRTGIFEILYFTEEAKDFLLSVNSKLKYNDYLHLIKLCKYISIKDSLLYLLKDGVIDIKQYIEMINGEN